MNSPKTQRLTAVRLPIGLIAVLIIVADYAGWGYPTLTALAVSVIIALQVLISVIYMYAMWRTTKYAVPSFYGGNGLLCRYLYVCGFALAYALTEHWWLVVFQGVVLVTLTAFVVEHKNKT